MERGEREQQQWIEEKCVNKSSIEWMDGAEGGRKDGDMREKKISKISDEIYAQLFLFSSDGSHISKLSPTGFFFLSEFSNIFLELCLFDF